jgi:septum formation protein
MDSADIPVFIARKKAAAVQQEAGLHEIVLAADTVVVLDNHIIGKPRDREDAIRILTSLSGRTHRVITGVVISGRGKEVAFAEITEVSFHPLLPEQVTYYIDQYKPYDKAGAYAIQEWIGVTGIEWIRGDFYNVMGLPVSKVVHALKTF